VNAPIEKPVIAIVGSAMIDLVCYVDQIPHAGQTLMGNEYFTSFGGKGANQAAMASLCGGDIYFIGTLGSDNFGDDIAKNFHDLGIDARFVERGKLPTGVAHIWVEKTGENRIVVVPGANNETSADRARNAIMKIPNLRVVIGQLEIDQEITLSAFSAAKERGCTTILNPAPYQAVSASLLAATDWVIPNESEFEGFDHRAITSNVIVTLGAQGAQLRIKGQPESNISTKKVDVVDSTGAGDAFVGTFAFALASGREVRKAVELACAVASQSVTRKGAQISYPRASELAGLINA
jgi:ribokinase